MTYRTEDPLADFNRWDAAQESELSRLPKCADCGEVIQDEYFYLINDEPICEECLNLNYRKCTEDYID